MSGQPEIGDLFKIADELKREADMAAFRGNEITRPRAVCRSGLVARADARSRTS